MSPSPSLAVHAEDTVFLRDEDERGEYVLAQQGLIYQGACEYITSTPWNFGQVRGTQPQDPRVSPALSLRAWGLLPLVYPQKNAPNAASTPGRVCPPCAVVGQTNQGPFAERGAGDSAGQSEGMFLMAQGALGPHVPNQGDHAVLGAGTDNVLPGAVPVVLIRQRPHPSCSAHGHAGGTRPPSELWAVLGAVGRVGAGVPVTLQDPQFREVP